MNKYPCSQREIYNWGDSVTTTGFPGGSDSKESTCNTGDLGSIPEMGRSIGEESGYLLRYSGLENSMDGGTW